MIDPFERYFSDEDGRPSSGRIWNLKDILHKRDHVDQLEPIREALPLASGFGDQERFPGTFFRFPLRSSASKLSSSVYTRAETFELLRAFRTDASIVLLFLRNIESIEIFHKVEHLNDSNTYLKVFIDHTDLSDLRSCRKRFCSALEGVTNTPCCESDITMTTNFDVITQIERNSLAEKWVVHQEIVFTCSGQIQELHKRLKFLPWIGVAVPMFQQEVSCGRTFCFFPLPPGEESNSGLPVHVHGFFGVSDDRRSLKWPGGDQIQNEEAKWNKLLVDGILPQVYRKALLKATRVSTHFNIDPNVVYTAFPDTRKDLGHWRTSVERMYSDLFNHPMLFCHSKDEWMPVQNVLILPQNLLETPQQQEVVVKCLKLYGQCVIEHLPDHVRDALNKFCLSTKFVSTQIIIDCIKGQTLDEFSQHEKLCLLMYLLQGGCLEKQLRGLRLIPTDAGDFVPFIERPSLSDMVYLDTLSCPRKLLPNMTNRFLLRKGNGHLRHLWDFFEDMASSDSWKQFKYVGPDEIVRLLPAALPEWWSTSDCKFGDWYPSSEHEPELDWLRLIWQFIANQRIDLIQLQGLKLFPVSETTGDSIKMVALLKSSKIMQKPNEDELPPNYFQMQYVLETVGVTVCTLPTFVSSYHEVFEASFVHTFNPTGVLKILHLVDSRLIEKICLSNKTVQELLVAELFSYISGATFSTNDSQLLKKMSVFIEDQDLSNNPGNLTSLCDSQVIIEPETKTRLPKTILHKVCIQVSNADVLHLVRKLGFHPKSFDDLLLCILHNAKEKKYSSSEIKSLFQWVKANYHTIKHIKDICNLLGKIRFVPNEQNALKRPNEVFDTSDNLVSVLVVEKDVLPLKNFLESWRDILVDLGLKTRMHIQIDHLRKAAEKVTAQKDPHQAGALLEYLCAFPKCLSNNRHFCNFMKGVPFISCVKHPPVSYPRSMPFYNGRGILLKPTDVVIYTEETCHLVGAVVPLVESISQKSVIRLLGIPLKPCYEDVILQLEICVSAPSGKCPTNTLHHIYTFLNDVATKNKSIVQRFPEKWIFVDDQFVESKRVYREGGRRTLDLRPFLFVLPRELKKYESLFSAADIPSKFQNEVGRLLQVLHEMASPDCNYTVGPERKVAISMDILRRLQELPDNVLQDENVQRQLLIPTRCTPIKLLPPDQVCYCDADWMIHGMNPEDLQLEDDEDPIYIVNDVLSPHMAERFGVVPLSQRLAGADEVGGIKQTGQSEALTVRLKNILRNGYQPEAIPKEMVQNAEDAGASEVKFLLDLRRNEDKMKRLLDPAMEDVQGPALWVYNDATFTDADLENITKLGGGTKSEDGSKIGQFGLGFNAVYHLTDVPSFVTKDVITFFDPHQRYLKRQIRGNGTGIQLNFLSSSLRMQRFRDQFLPYDGIFGCQLIRDDGLKPEPFEGTIFRLPLRNEKSARRSDICPESYCESNMKPLLKHLCDTATNMLLFTEKVSSISVYLWEDSAKDKSLLYKVERKTIAGNNLFKDAVHRCMKLKGDMPSDTVAEMEFSGTWSEKGIQYFDVKELKCQKKETWIKVASTGKGQVHRLCTSKLGKVSGLLPCGGVAWSPSKRSGNVFCFLPLSVPPSNLPVHINGAFAVSADRRNLWRGDDSLESESAHFKSEWNNAVCNDVVVSAYITLLKDRKVREYGSEHMNSFSLWPNLNDTSTKGDYGKVVTGFYQVVAKGSTGETPPKVFFKGGRFLSIEEIAFGDESVQNNEIIFPVFQKIVEQNTNKTIIKLPSWVKKGFKEARCEKFVHNRTYSWITFFSDVVFPNLKRLAADQVNELIAFALSLRDRMVLDLMKRYECIPCDFCGGVVYKQPSALLDVDTFREMFYHDESVFPASLFLQNLDGHQLETLREIGGMRKDLSGGEILERAKTVESLWKSGKELAMKRTNALLKYIGCKIGNPHFEHTICDVRKDLQTVAFLPAVRGAEDEVLESCKNIFPPDKKSLVGEVCYILSNGSCLINMSPSVSAFLKIKGKAVKFKHVSENVQILRRRQLQGEVIVPAEHWISLYCYLEKNLHDPEVLEFIRREKCFFIDGHFVESCKLSRSSESFPPYLYRTPFKLKQFEKLLDAAHVKAKFNANDFIMALTSLKDDQNEEPLQADMLAMVLTKVIKPLFDIADKIPPEVKADIPLPDSHNILRPSGNLSFCDLEEFQHLLSRYHLSHKEIPLEHAKKLGVQDVRQQMLSRYSTDLPGCAGGLGKKFGQREELVNRIKRIMEGYPCDFAILKELVQNADDAKATVVHFVLDCRRHPDVRVFYDGMKGLQGPALLAYNDRPFSDEDIEGIQRLGEGSKGDAIDKTGRYGVGFNVVYHLTDCPMFLSEKDTLCVFDPTLKFVEDATASSPGRMFRPVDEMMIESYADIFKCFLSFEEIRGKGSLEKGSLFRFPLRSKDSTLGGRKSVTDMKQLLQQFKIEMFDSLLFLKSVREISISIIEQFARGKCSTYSVKAELTEDASRQREMFLRNLSQHGKSLDVDVSDLSYITWIRDNAGNEEEWLVHQRLGVESKDEIPESVRHADDFNDLRLIPKGGVAARLSATSFLQETREVKAMSFCFLPLPVLTNLPVHVDGYFALGHEARRDLWHAPKGDARSDWNYLLAKDVICCSYVRVIETIKDQVTRSHAQGIDTDVLKQKLEYYHSFFPLFPRNEKGHQRSALEEICHAFYKKIAAEECKLFPVLFENTLKWCSCMHRAKDRGYFYAIPSQFEEQQQQDLRCILLNLGFPVLKSPLEICNAMKIVLQDHDEGVVLEVSPANVVNFLKTDAKELSLFDIPQDLRSTAVGNTYRLKLLLRYILFVPDLSLSGIPLLLTNDGVLREFLKEQPVFHSRFYALLPKCSNEFLHKNFLGIIPSSDDCCKEMALTDLENRLQSYLPKAQFCQDDYLLRTGKLPTADWLQMLWGFLNNLVLGQCSTHKDVVQTLGNWCIFPACNEDYRYLVPMKLAKTVLSTKSSKFHTEVKRILRNLNCPFVDIKAVEETSSFCIHFASDLDNVSDVLLVLERQLRNYPDCNEKLQDGDHMSILRYFGPGILTLSEESRNIIRRLPFFETISGDHTALFKKAYAVSMTGIPVKDQDKWVPKSTALLLKKSKIPEEVLKGLEIDEIEDKELYKRFVLPYFESFSLEARWSHLNKLMRMVRTDEDPDNVVLSLHLSSTPLITHKDGTLKLAQFYHDIDNPVFREMSSEDMFPPKHPESSQQSHWTDFLRRIGLQTEVSKTQFEDFITALSRNDNGNRSREEILVTYLFSSHHLHESTYFHRIASIPFITAANVDDRYSELHKQYQVNKVALSAVSEEHRNLVWSVEALLPDWIKPSSCASCGDSLMQNTNKTKQPTIKQVLSHTKTLLLSFKSSNRSQNATPPAAMKHERLVNKVIIDILGFLSQKCMRAETCGHCADKSNCCDNCQLVSEALNDVAIVPVGNGVCFKAKRLTKSLLLPEHDKLFLFLREIPDFLKPQKNLLYCLGATATPSLLQYANALQLIAREKDNLQKNTPLYLAAQQAIDGFFACLSEEHSNDMSEVKILFLLTTDKKTPLLDSKYLYYNDEPTFQRRLRSFPHQLMKPVHSEEVTKKSNFLELLSKLGTLRPKLISENVEEMEIPFTHTSQNLIGYDCSCALSQQLRNVLSWSTFRCALKLILTHEGMKDLSVHEESLQTSFKVCCLSHIQTQLHLKEEGVIPESKADSGAIFGKGDEAEAILFLSHHAKPALVHSQIAQRFFRFLKIPLEDTKKFEAILKAENEDDMFDTLSRLRIDTSGSDLEEPFHAPELGSDIEEDVICLLEQNPLTDFSPEEYVGYNKTESIEEHFVYAKVIRRVESRATAEVEEQCWQYAIRYVIDIGEEIEVAAIWLYNFPRPDDSDVPTSNNTSVELYDECRTPQRPTHQSDDFSNLQQTKREITQIIEALWKEEKAIRQTGLRRLMRQWHPDKHKPENKAFAEEVFKHIRNEIERLEKGVSSGVDTADDIFKWARRNNSQQQRYWRNHGRRYGHGRSKGSRKGSRNWRQWRSRSFFTPPSFRRDNDEARRWQRQARIDLQAASSLKEPFFQWICCLCFHAVEKSVRAAQLVCGCHVSEKHTLTDAAGELKRHLDIISFISKLVEIVKEKSHYPSSCQSPRIPHEVYTRDDSTEAICIANDVLGKVDAYLEDI